MLQKNIKVMKKIIKAFRLGVVRTELSFLFLIRQKAKVFTKFMNLYLIHAHTISGQL